MKQFMALMGFSNHLSQSEEDMLKRSQEINHNGHGSHVSELEGNLNSQPVQEGINRHSLENANSVNRFAQDNEEIACQYERRTKIRISPDMKGLKSKRLSNGLSECPHMERAEQETGSCHPGMDVCTDTELPYRRLKSAGNTIKDSTKPLNGCGIHKRRKQSLNPLIRREVLPKEECGDVLFRLPLLATISNDQSCAPQQHCCTQDLYKRFEKGGIKRLGRVNSAPKRDNTPMNVAKINKRGRPPGKKHQPSHVILAKQDMTSIKKNSIDHYEFTKLSPAKRGRRAQKGNSTNSQNPSRRRSQKKTSPRDNERNLKRKAVADDENAVVVLHSFTTTMGVLIKEATKPESRSRIVHRACRARIKLGMVKGAIDLCQHVISQWYREATQITEQIQDNSGTDQAFIRMLIGMRTDIAELWCTYCRVILDVAYFLCCKRKNQPLPTVDVKNLQPFICDGQHRMSILKSLIRKAIATLTSAIKCPLVGNHYFITLGLARVTHLEFDCGQSVRSFGYSSETKGSKLDLTLSAIVSVDFQSIKMLSSTLQKSISSEFIFVDPSSEFLIKGERNQTKGNAFPGDSDKSLRKLTAIHQVQLASQSLSVFPVLPVGKFLKLNVRLRPIEKTEDDEIISNGTPTLLVSDFDESESRPSSLYFTDLDLNNSSRECDRVLGRDSCITSPTTLHLDSIEGDSFQEEINVRIGCEIENLLEVGIKIEETTTSLNPPLAGVYAASTDYLAVQCDAAHGSKVFDVEWFDMSGQRWNRVGKSLTHPRVTYHEGFKDRIFDTYPSKHVTNVEQISSNCLLSTFISQGEMDAHKKVCTRRKGNQRSVLEVGKSHISRKWMLSSFDPENGQGVPLQNLINVLEYSVELFDVKENSPSITPDEIVSESFITSSPSFIGQIGLRCQYCVDKECFASKGSFVFPSTTNQLSQAMWQLCLGHLDYCPNQPGSVRANHREYRERVALHSDIVADYWKDTANDIGLQNRRGKLGLVWRT